jgi:hypothetical protein
LHIQPKGTGLVTISDGTDFNKGIRFRSSSSAASAVTLLDAVSTAGRVVTLPDATTTLVGRDTTDTLTNKTINLTSNTLVATSAQMAAAVSDETGSGSLVFATSPTLVTPILGTPTSGDFSTGTFTWPTFNQNTTGTAAGLSATLAIGSGGTGQTTAAAAITALTGTQTSGQYLRSDGTNAALAAIQAGDVPTLNQNTSGTAAGLSATLAVSSGGTGQTSYTDGQLLIGNSTGNTLTKATLTAGTNVTITNAAGAITIAASGGGASAATPTALGTVYGRYDVANYITYVGNATGNTSSTASHNVGVGSGAMAAITTGTRNIVLGSYAAAALTTGEGNVVLGTFGVGTGTNTFASNTSGSDNIAIGGQSLTANTTASYNIAIGAKALSANTTGTPNLAIGLSSLQANTTGGSNVALGDNTLRSNTTASNNTAVGYQAGYSTTTGTHNAALGYLAGYSNTTGTYNSYIGIGAGYSMTTGSKNTIVGNFSGNSGGIDIRTTSNYIVLSDGDGNVAYYFAGANNFVANDGNFVSGAYSRGTGSQYFTDFRVGWTSNTSVGTQVGYIYSPSGSTTLYTTASDRRLKQNIVDAPSAINDVMAIEIKSFDWISNNEHQKYGVIAQDLHLIAPDAVSIPENAENMCAVDYSVLVPMLIKSIQEIKTEFDAYKATHP